MGIICSKTKVKPNSGIVNSVTNEIKGKFAIIPVQRIFFLSELHLNVLKLEKCKDQNAASKDFPNNKNQGQTIFCFEIKYQR